MLGPASPTTSEAPLTPPAALRLSLLPVHGCRQRDRSRRKQTWIDLERITGQFLLFGRWRQQRAAVRGSFARSPSRGWRPATTASPFDLDFWPP